MVVNFLFDSVIPHLEKNNFKKLVRLTARQILADENLVCGNLNFRFCDDITIKDYNRKYLSHDYETDILTFYYECGGNNFDGDILISTETVKDNSVRFKTGFKNELMRVVIHGVLHLCGYKDSDSAGKSAMRKKENYYLKLFVK
ncbi:MAG: rRNA maturation RNase YbeY [Ignavibacteriae bacterium]|nr:rRNA maturation RNase YbeY [Ignavibacteriota bacterium]